MRFFRLVQSGRRAFGHSKRTRRKCQT